MLSTAELMRHPRKAAAPGSRGAEMGLYELAELKGSHRILVGDVSFIPAESDGLVVDVPPGDYGVKFAILDYGADWRISRFVIASSGRDLRRGGRIGRTWTDTGKTGICDLDVVVPAWGADWDASYARMARWTEGEAPFGVAQLDSQSGAIIPFVESGFGDGDYPVYELVTTDGRRAGFEVVFVPPHRRYPKPS